MSEGPSGLLSARLRMVALFHETTMKVASSTTTVASTDMATHQAGLVVYCQMK